MCKHFLFEKYIFWENIKMKKKKLVKDKFSILKIFLWFKLKKKEKLDSQITVSKAATLLCVQLIQIQIES